MIPPTQFTSRKSQKSWNLGSVVGSPMKLDVIMWGRGQRHPGISGILGETPRTNLNLYCNIPRTPMSYQFLIGKLTFFWRIQTTNQKKRTKDMVQVHVISPKWCFLFRWFLHFPENSPVTSSENRHSLLRFFLLQHQCANKRLGGKKTPNVWRLLGDFEIWNPSGMIHWFKCWFPFNYLENSCL